MSAVGQEVFSFLLRFFAPFWCHLVSAQQPLMKHLDFDSPDDPEKIAAIRKIRKLMDFWQIHPHELRGRVVPVAATVALPVIRYRHPISGLTWDGNGSQPPWLREALLREGYTPEELRRAAQQQAEDSTI